MPRDCELFLVIQPCCSWFTCAVVVYPQPTCTTVQSAAIMGALPLETAAGSARLGPGVKRQSAALLMQRGMLQLLVYPLCQLQCVQVHGWTRQAAWDAGWTLFVTEPMCFQLNRFVLLSGLLVRLKMS